MKVDPWNALGVVFALIMLLVVFPAGCQTKRDLDASDKYFLESLERLKGSRP